ncbi:thiolase family protein [uncultured Roseibium sp.]|uniref:thiolase family protein n=1 Tax=uncultured Roseibium sp. TaxID=1936171 RepID=UPI0026169758|nr:thiolase family protein [uncultured Roseibium sp.]
MSAPAYIIAARRTQIAPRGGALAALQADELAAPVLRKILKDAGIPPASVDQVLLGNALYAGGNPARLAALRAGLPPGVPAMTVDTQCCSGLDAIILAVRLIEAGAADCVLAGGAESFSRAPIRSTHPMDKDAEPVPYNRPPFAPSPFADPDLTEAAARLAEQRGIRRERQAEFAVSSHAKAIKAQGQMKLVDVLGKEGGTGDGFTRNLSVRTALRAPVLTGDEKTGVTAATIACEADGAAAVLLVSDQVWKASGKPGLKILAGKSGGGDPADPALVPIEVAASLFERLALNAPDFDVIELMEAYAVQAMVTADRLGIETSQLNRLGGALARGHPIGASGAVLAVQLFEMMLRTSGNAGKIEKSRGLALIAAAGGLGSGLAVERVDCEGG